jgi:SAM-dependent methyltransferase
MRATWDALASDPDVFVGDPARGRAELEGLLGRLGADPRGGTCVEVGCGSGRMTGALAERFDRVVALDVSPAMLAHARAATRGDAHVEFHAISGERLEPVADASAAVVVCYLVLQHLPSRRAVATYLREFARVLTPGGEAFVQLPVLDGRPRARAWRAVRSALVPLLRPLGPTARPEFRGVRVTRAELDAALAHAGLVVAATATGPDAPYRYSTDLFLRLTRPR